VLVFYLLALAVGAGLAGMQVLGHHGGGHGGGSHEAAWTFLSTRFWAFALLATGIAGSAMTIFQLAGPVLTAMISIPTGLGLGAGAHVGLRALGGREVTSTASLSSAVGNLGRVLLPPAPGTTGKIRLMLKGQSVDVLATTDDSGIEKDAQVVVAEIRDGVAHVAKAPKELLP
jgi:hypothetical protein